MKPVIVKVGVALTLSLAGLLYSRLRNRRAKFSQPPDPPCSSGFTHAFCWLFILIFTWIFIFMSVFCWYYVCFHFSYHGGDVDVGGRVEMKKTATSGSVSSISVDKHEDTYRPNVPIGNPLVVVSPNSRQGGDKDGYLLPEFDNLVNGFDFTPTNTGIKPKKDLVTFSSDVDTPRAFRNEEEDDSEQEIRHLRAMVRKLREREKNLEFQLLEFCGLKEQENAMIELQNRLKISNMEAKIFTLKIESLQAENQRLQEQVADHVKVAYELDAARAKIKLLRKLLKSEAEQNKEQILTLQKRVTRLYEQEVAQTGSDIQLKLEKLKDLEVEAEDLRQSKIKLHLENSELICKLESAQILANSVLQDPEMEALRKLSNQLRQENEELEKKVERLQADRCMDVEELVYLRWINACLRYELRNFQPEHGKTVARDLSKSLSPKSEDKAKQLILEYAYTEGLVKGINILDLDSDLWSSSRTSFVADSGELDDSPVSPKSNNLSTHKIFKKLRRLIRGKDVQHRNRRSSGGMTTITEDNDSPGGSSSISTTDAASDSGPRHSADIQRMKNPKMDELKDMEIGRCYSDMGSTYGHKRAFSDRITANCLSAENQHDQGSYSDEKSELLKFAEVLKDSEHKTRKYHRKATSLGSFKGIQRSTSE